MTAEEEIRLLRLELTARALIEKGPVGPQMHQRREQGTWDKTGGEAALLWVWLAEWNDLKEALGMTAHRASEGWRPDRTTPPPSP